MLSIKQTETDKIALDARDKFKSATMGRLNDMKRGCLDCKSDDMDFAYISLFVLSNWKQDDIDGEAYYNLNTPNGIFSIYSRNNF